MGAAVRRRAVRQRVAVAILLVFWYGVVLRNFITLEKYRSRQGGEIVGVNNLASDNCLCCCCRAEVVLCCCR